MNFSEYIQFSLSGDAWEGREDEVQALAHEKIARTVERNLRGRVDFGIDPRAALKAQSISVRSEEGRLIIETEDQAGVLGGSSTEGEPDADSILDLFSPSSGVPSVRTDNFGNTKLAFREVSPDRLFETEKRAAINRDVEQSVVETVRAEVGQAFVDAIDEVERRYPIVK